MSARRGRREPNRASRFCGARVSVMLGSTSEGNAPELTMFLCQRVSSNVVEMLLSRTSSSLSHLPPPTIPQWLRQHKYLTESWSSLRAIKKSSPVGTSNSSGIVERATQSVQGMVQWRVKLDVTHSVWPWQGSRSVVTAKRSTSDQKENQRMNKGCHFRWQSSGKGDGQEARLES